MDGGVNKNSSGVGMSRADSQGDSAWPGIIYYLTVGAPTSGGQRVNEEHVIALRQMGWDARLLQWPRSGPPEAQWPRWAVDCPVVPMTSAEVLKPHDVVVIPEPWRHQIEVLARVNVHKVIHNQNPYYGFRAADALTELPKLGIGHILTCSEFTSAFLRRSGWQGPLHTVHPQLDPVFAPGPDERELRIAYMPRKRSVEAMFMPSLFRSLYPQWAAVPWLPLHDMSRAQCAQLMQQSAVFASFSHLEGLGLPPLEAARCGCVVAGFTGGGGQDYATPANGFWVAEGDHEGFAHALHQALRCAQSATWRAGVLKAFEPALADHTTEAFQRSLALAWAAVMADLRARHP
jgi:Glycosyl transferases group 1